MNLLNKFYFILLSFLFFSNSVLSSNLDHDKDFSTKSLINNFQVRFMLRSEFKGIFDGEENSIGYANKPAMIAAGFDMGEKLSFYGRYRFDLPSTIQKDGTPVSLLNFNLQYKPIENLKIVVGKQTMLQGSWEFEYNPIDVYYYSLMGNNIQGFVSGVALHYDIKKSHLAFQLSKVVDQDFLWNDSSTGVNGTLYYSADLKNGFYKPIWSYTYTYAGDNRSLHNVMIGNQFNINRFRLEVDLMAQNAFRYYAKEQKKTDEYSVVGKLEYFLPKNRVSLATKYAFDRRNLASTGEKVTEEHTCSMQMRYLLSKNYNINLHSTVAYRVNERDEKYSDIFSGNREKFFSIGFTWDFTTKSL